MRNYHPEEDGNFGNCTIPLPKATIRKWNPSCRFFPGFFGDSPDANETMCLLPFFGLADKKQEQFSQWDVYIYIHNISIYTNYISYHINFLESELVPENVVNQQLFLQSSGEFTMCVLYVGRTIQWTQPILLNLRIDHGHLRAIGPIRRLEVDQFKPDAKKVEVYPGLPRWAVKGMKGPNKHTWISLKKKNLLHGILVAIMMGSP